MTVTNLLDQLSENGIALSINGDKLRVHNNAALTDELRQALKKYKAELIARLEIPRSFYERPCCKCGTVGQARRREDGRWLCICYFAAQEAVTPTKPKEKLPEWLIIDSYAWKKLLANGTPLDELMERRAIGLQQLALRNGVNNGR